MVLVGARTHLGSDLRTGIDALWSSVEGVGKVL